jgi:integrase/recombinase XerC
MPVTIDTRHPRSLMVANEDLLDLYRAHLERRGLAAVTIGRRLAALRMLGDLGPLLELDAERIECFLDARHGRAGRLDPRTRTCWISHLHTFYAWALAFDHAQVDPTARLVRPKLRRKLPRPIPEADFARAVERAPTPMLRAWLLLAGNAGLRCCEIAGLRGDDVHSGTLRVVGKGAKERVVPMHPRVGELAAGWPVSGPVFVDPATGLPYRAAQVSKALGDFFRRERLPYRAHQARHRFASAVYAETGDVLVVAELCGHESIETARIYAAVSAERRRAAVLRIA